MNIKGMLLGDITLDELLNYYNASIHHFDYECKQIRGFVDYYKGHYFIYINRHLSYYLKRKTLLHELAHIELNQLCQNTKDLISFFIDQYEDEADKYIKQLESEIRSYDEV